MKILLYLLFLSAIFTQTKIDNITIPDSVASLYFRDCFENPDIVRSYSLNIYDNQKMEALAIKTETIWDNPKASLKMSVGYIYYIPRKPSSTDYIKWLYRHNQRIKIKEL